MALPTPSRPYQLPSYDSSFRLRAKVFLFIALEKRRTATCKFATCSQRAIPQSHCSGLRSVRTQDSELNDKIFSIGCTNNQVLKTLESVHLSSLSVYTQFHIVYVQELLGYFNLYFSEVNHCVLLIVDFLSTSSFKYLCSAHIESLGRVSS